MKDPNIPRNATGDPIGTSRRKPRYTPPQPGWREKQQQCASHPMGSRCQEAVTRWSPMCARHTALTPVRSPYSAALGALGPKYEAHRKDKYLTDNREQIATFKTYLTWLMENAGQEEDKVRPLFDRLDQLDRMVDRYLSQERERSAVWNAQDIRAFGLALGQLVNRMVRDERDKQSLIEGLKNLMSGVDLLAIPLSSELDSPVIDAET